MHLGLDLLFLLPGETGGRETYARELLGALREVRPDLTVTTFLNRESRGPGWWHDRADHAVVLSRVSARFAPAWAAGEVALLPRAAARARVDVLHAPANFAPLGGPFARVVTLHDLIFRRLPDSVSTVRRWGTEAVVPAAARRAHRVITGSAAARDDLVAELSIPAECIDVIPHGVTLIAGGQPDALAARRRLRANPDRPIALSVAGAVAHKNLDGLLSGLAAMPASDRPLLVLAGAGTDGPALVDYVQRRGIQGDVRLLGAIDSAELEDLYAAAAMLVTATRYEGFGLPVLEAMARDTPVACSDLPVLREVAGDAALYLDPADPMSIAAAVLRLASGGAEAERLRLAGRARVAAFSWRAAARATAEAYQRAMLTRRTVAA